MIEPFQQILSALFTAGTLQEDSDLSCPGSSGIATVTPWCHKMFNNLLPAGAGAQGCRGQAQQLQPRGKCSP